jgi:hypothetical protein
MQTALRVAAVTALLLAATSTLARAATCELRLKSLYECSGTYSDGTSGNYCIHLDVGIPGDGKFALYEAGVPNFYCTCEAKGKAPNVRFGASSRDFFCASDFLALSATIAGGKISGHGYHASLFPGLRSSFTCRAVATCP